MPWNIHFHAQAFVVRYDGSEEYSVDKYLKAYVGWQANAFTTAYVGWSGERRWDPVNSFPVEEMVNRGLFAKLAYAIHF